MATLILEPNQKSGRSWIHWNFLLAIGLIVAVVLLSSQMIPGSSHIRVIIPSAHFPAAEATTETSRVSRDLET